MTDRSQAGFTLIELMTAIALAAVIGAALFALGGEARHGAWTAATLGDRLEGYRRALDVLADDLRRATAVATDEDGVLQLAWPDHRATWRRVGDALVRTQDDRETFTARAVEALDVTREGPRYQVALRISPRTTLRTIITRRIEEVR